MNNYHPLKATAEMITLASVPSHSPAIVTKNTGEEYVLVPVINNIADMDSLFTLNETGAFIWEQIDGKKSVRQIVMALTREYDIPERIAEDDVLEFIDNMKEYLIIKD
ncbi:MAG: PqqD family protein [Bacteroidales bacterium]|nr:PqqD family protein [Bacteroidales bacterium]